MRVCVGCLKYQSSGSYKCWEELYSQMATSALVSVLHVVKQREEGGSTVGDENYISGIVGSWKTQAVESQCLVMLFEVAR